MFKYKQFLIGFLAVLILSWIFFSNSFFTSHLKVETMRLYEMDKCIKDGQIPCRWVPDLGEMYGYPLFNYYGPLTYYFAEGLYLLNNNFLFSVKLTFMLAIIGAYCFVYFLSKNKLTYKKVLLGLFYSIGSYLFVTFFLTGSIGEMWLFMLAPALIWSLRRFNNYATVKNSLLLILISSMLVLSHSLGILLLIFFFAFLTVPSLFKKQNTKLLKIVTLSFVLSLSLAAFYLGPMVLEKKLVHSSKITLSNIFSLDGSGSDFLPIYIERPQKKAIIDRYTILTGSSTVSNYKSGTNWITFQANTNTHSIIRLSQHYFPNWKIIVDGKETESGYKSNGAGMITILLGPGTHIVEARLFDTSIRTLSNTISIIGVLFYVLLILTQVPPTKQWLSYYLKGLYR